MNKYVELINKQREEVNLFPIMFAFSEKQFDAGMEKLGLTPEDTDKIISIGAGGYIKKEDLDDFENLFTRHEEEIKNQIDRDKTGEGFIYDMFVYELQNHEYGYTRDLSDTLNAVNLSMKSITDHENILSGLILAKKYVLSEEE